MIVSIVLLFWLSKIFLTGKVNRQNVKILESENPYAEMEHRRDSAKVNVWYCLIHDFYLTCCSTTSFRRSHSICQTCLPNRRTSSALEWCSRIIEWSFPEQGYEEMVQRYDLRARSTLRHSNSSSRNLWRTMVTAYQITIFKLSRHGLRQQPRVWLLTCFRTRREKLITIRKSFKRWKEPMLKINDFYYWGLISKSRWYGKGFLCKNRYFKTK